MIIALSFLLAQAGGYSPEIEAVMRRRGQPLQQEKKAQPNDALRAVVPPQQLQRFSACIDQAASDPGAAIETANAWIIDRGGIAAQQCLGLAYGRTGNWRAAATAFAQAAHATEQSDSMTASRMWGQAGNASLAASDFAAARQAFDSAIASAAPQGVATGELYLDRARVLVATGDMAGGRRDLDRAVALAPRDPLAWLLSATLARRMDDLSLARGHIATAAALAPDDPSVALEQGVIAALGGRDVAARQAFEQVKAVSPQSPQAQAADRYLAELDTHSSVTGGADAQTPR